MTFRENRNDSFGELNLAQAIALVLAKWKWVVSLTVLVTLTGVVYALLAPSKYYAEATIGIKDYGKSNNASNVFSQLGGLGGAVAAQLGGGNTNLNKIEIILKGHELATSVITSGNLLPILYPKKWKSSRKPTVSQGAEHLRRDILSVDADTKRNVIQVGVTVQDPLFAKRLIEYYLDGLNYKIRADAIADAEQNREFLEKQLAHVSDPILVEKINGLIAAEIEKMMFVNSQTVEVLEGPMVPLTRSSPKRARIVIVFFFAGLVVSVASVFASMALSMIRTRVSEVWGDRSKTSRI